MFTDGASAACERYLGTVHRIGYRRLMVEPQTQIEFIRSAGERIALVAPKDLDATVPTCPDMTIRDLLGHTAMLCNWMGKCVTTRNASSGFMGLRTAQGQNTAISP